MPLESLGRIVEAVDSHTAGEPTRMVVGLERALGAAVPGATMAERRDYLREHHDGLRRALVLEPRGHDAIVLAFLTDPVTEGAHAGVVFANDAGYLGMCGHGAIGVATCLVRLGIVAPAEPTTEVVLDTPVGRVVARVQVAGGAPQSVSLANVPAFVQQLDREVAVPGLGRVRVDVAFGGNWFAFVRQGDVGVPIEPAHIDALLRASRRVRDALTSQGITGIDPLTGAKAHIDHIGICADESTDGAAAVRAMTLCPGRAYDRSPCGTGTSAKLAVLHRRRLLAVGQPLLSRSVLGTEFRARILDVTEVAGSPAVLPEVTGSAFVTGLQRFVLDPADPWAYGLPPVGGAES